MGRSRKISIASKKCLWVYIHCIRTPEAWLGEGTGIVAEVSTCRRHCGSKHAVSITYFPNGSCSLPLQGKYRSWCKKTGFESKIPGDVIARKLKPEQSRRTIDGYLVEKKSTDGSVAYSDRLFQQAAVEWLVATDQVRRVLYFSLPTNTFCSRLKHLSIRSLRKWLTLHPTLPTVSKFLIAGRPKWNQGLV